MAMIITSPAGGLGDQGPDLRSVAAGARSNLHAKAREVRFGSGGRQRRESKRATVAAGWGGRLFWDDTHFCERNVMLGRGDVSIIGNWILTIGKRESTIFLVDLTSVMFGVLIVMCLLFAAAVAWVARERGRTR